MFPPDYGYLLRRLLGYLIVIAAMGTAFWLFAFLRDVY